MSKQENFKTLIDGELKARLDAVLGTKKLSLTAFVENVVRWFLEQDDLVQSMVVRQLSPRPDARAGEAQVGRGGGSR